jgi:hypothetical protein
MFVCAITRNVCRRLLKSAVRRVRISICFASILLASCGLHSAAGPEKQTGPGEGPNDTVGKSPVRPERSSPANPTAKPEQGSEKELGRHGNSAVSNEFGKNLQQDRRKSARLWKESQDFADRGKYRKAFSRALKGWQLLQRYKTSDNSRQLANKIWQGLKRYGEASNQQHTDPGITTAKRKPLVIE